MDRYYVIRNPLGGSDVYDSGGKQVGYSLPGVAGSGEDFYDMDGNPVGQSFDDLYGGADFIGTGNGSYGYMDREMMAGRNGWLHGDPFGERREEEPDFPGFGEDDAGMDSPDDREDYHSDYE